MAVQILRRGHKKEKLTDTEHYLNAWYVHNRVNRFCSSRSTAPMYLYRLVNHRFSLYALTQVRKQGTLQVLARPEDDKIMEIWDENELLFVRSESITLHTIHAIQSNLHKHGSFRGSAA